MNVPTLEMETDLARRHYLEYRQAVADRGTAEDKAIMRAYRELAKGRQLVDVLEAMRDAGQDPETKLPRLAIARADARVVWYHHASQEVLFAIEQRWHSRMRADKCIVLPNGAGGLLWSSPRNWTYQAMVPIIPPAHRPRSGISNYHILWEAAWQEVPHDPILLRHVHGYLYAVLAAWDLTEIERAVLSDRLRRQR